MMRGFPKVARSATKPARAVLMPKIKRRTRTVASGPRAKRVVSWGAKAWAALKRLSTAWATA